VKEGANPEMDQIRKLVSGRLKAQTPGPHPDPDMLAAFAEKALSETERAQLLRHLGACSDCREILYLAMPDAHPAQEALSFQPKPRFGFALRWGTLVASVAIAAGLLATMRHKAGTAGYEARVVMPKSTPPAPAQIAKQEPPSEFDKLADRDQFSPRREDSPIRSKELPEKKHMTAKLQTGLKFDQSDQVKVIPEKRAADSSKLSADEKDLAVDGRKMPSAPAGAMPSVLANGRSADEKPRSMNETVEVTSQAPVAEYEGYAAQGSAGKISSEKSDLKKEKSIATNSMRQVSAFNLPMPVPQWKLSKNGALQRSLDSGKTWRELAVGSGIVFRAVTSLGSDVWAGGNAGALYRSKDFGQTWGKLEPVADGKKLEQDVVHIEFSDPSNGSISTADGQTWTTSDSGKSWSRK
jgi:hypothetical protein